jgi:hypothetical protein
LVGRNGRSASDKRRGGRWLQATVALGLVLLSCSVAAAAADPKADAKAKKDSVAELMPVIDRIVEAQRALAATQAQLHEQLSETQRALTELRDETRDKHDAAQHVLDGVADQVEGMRKEVWGLYVESSGLKGDIAQTDKQVEGLGESLGNFRLSAGIVVAVVIVLQVVLVGLTFRGRG